MLTDAAPDVSHGEEHSSESSKPLQSDWEGLRAHRVTAFMQGMMKTEAGKRMAQHRHLVMEQFLQDFYSEWDANA